MVEEGLLHASMAGHLQDAVDRELVKVSLEMESYDRYVRLLLISWFVSLMMCYLSVDIVCIYLINNNNATIPLYSSIETCSSTVADY